MDMNKVYAIAFVVFAAIFTTAWLPKPAPPTPARKAVVVELFTSEGCSSCPPADALLIKFREQHRYDGVEVIPLGFHVDYWNSLGWQDRFSSAAYSQRQEDYANRMKLDGPYTPQMVVDGDTEFVGNNTDRARDAIAQAAGRSPGAQGDVRRAAVVRDFRKVGQNSGGAFESDVAFNSGKDWKRGDLRAVIFVQEKTSGKILEAAATSLAGTD